MTIILISEGLRCCCFLGQKRITEGVHKQKQIHHTALLSHFLIFIEKKNHYQKLSIKEVFKKLNMVFNPPLSPCTFDEATKRCVRATPTVLYTSPQMRAGTTKSRPILDTTIALRTTSSLKPSSKALWDFPQISADTNMSHPKLDIIIALRTASSLYTNNKALSGYPQNSAELSRHCQQWSSHTVTPLWQSEQPPVCNQAKQHCQTILRSWQSPSRVAPCWISLTL